MITKILHCADTHLRDRQYNNNSRAEDFRSSVRQVVDIAIQEEVRAILLAGDLLDTNRPSPTTLNFLFAMDRLLIQAGIPCYIVNGDHDKTEPPWIQVIESQRQDESPGGLRVLCNERVAIPDTDLTVFGLDFIGKTKERFLGLKDTLPAADILLWHTMVKEFAGFYGQDAVSIEELPVEKYHFIALGDVHTRAYKRHDATGCWVGYPGSTEVCKRDEPMEKSVTIVEFDDAHKVTELREIPLITRKAFALNMRHESDLNAALLEVEKFKDANPIVLGRYNSHIPNVVARFYAILNPDQAIIRLTPSPEVDGPAQEAANPEDDKTLSDFLPEFIQPSKKIFEVATACLLPGTDANTLINDYIESHANS